MKIGARTFFWTGTAIATLSAAAWVASYWWVGLQVPIWGGNRISMGFLVGMGYVQVEHSDRGSSPTGVEFRIGWDDDLGFEEPGTQWWPAEGFLAKSFFYAPGFQSSLTTLSVPLWMPLLVGISIACPAWFRVRARRKRAGCCPACGYDLRGAAHANCPECGRGIEVKPAAP